MQEMEKRYWRKWVPICAAIVLAMVIGSTALVFGIMKLTGAGEPLGEKFDDPAFAVNGHSSVAKVWLGSSNGSETTIKCSYFNGVRELETLRGGVTTITHEQTVEEGRMKLVLVLPGGEVADLSAGTSPCVINLPEGKTYLRLVGDATKFTCKFRIDR